MGDSPGNGFTGSVGFIGLGNMGHEMSQRLVANGFEVRVYDVRAEAMEPLIDAGAVGAESPADLANQCDVVLVSLPTPQIVREVALGEGGLIESEGLGTYIDLSTTGPSVSRAVADALSEKGIAVLDSPVSGGVPGARAGSLAIMVSGPRDALEQYRPVLEVIGKNVFYVGEQPGNGQAMKLLNNLLSASAFAITAEAMALGVKLGLDPDDMLEVLNVSSGLNTATRDKFPQSVVTGTFDYGFDIALMCKDINLCLAQAEEQKVPMWIGHNVQQLWNFVEVLSERGADFTTLARHVEEWAGVTVRSQRSTK